MNQIHIFFILSLVASFLMTAFCIECYNCESVSEPNCGEEFDMEEYFKIDCDQVAPPRYLMQDLESTNATACMKKIYKEYKALKYVRTCYFGDVNDTEIGCRMDPTMMDYQDVQCFVCDNENYCNSARTIKSTKEPYLQKYFPFLVFSLMVKIFN